MRASENGGEHTNGRRVLGRRECGHHGDAMNRKVVCGCGRRMWIVLMRFCDFAAKLVEMVSPAVFAVMLRGRFWSSVKSVGYCCAAMSMR